MSLRDLLSKYRANAASEREKGTYFERLVKVWLENAPSQKTQFSRVMMFGDWAQENRFDQRDTGIDLVAQLADSPDDWCAIQCKFYREGYRIQKGDIDSFFTASGKRPFTRRMIVDTTGVQWSEHAEEALRNQIVETTRVGLIDLEDSGIDWQAFAATQTVKLLDKKKPRPHQIEALEAVKAGLAQADRGKIIMACGTGKTYTALHIAEQMVGKGGRVLFLVPSLSLMSQSIREWSIDANIPLRCFAVCSDSQVGVRKAMDGDVADIDVHDLEIPATTHGATIAAKATPAAPDSMTVVFSTYQSIQAVSAAQLSFGLPEFDLIICDEAHRTTGVKLADEEESNFIRVHDAAYIRGKKRLYMTATPRIFGDGVKKTADEVDAVLCSMDDPKLFGETLFTRNFSWAVQNGLLTDYKVIVLAVDEESVSAGVQRLLADENSELKLDDATKIIGCYKALTKADLKPDVAGDTGPMRRALAFAKDIKRSVLVAAEFPHVAAEWRKNLEPEVAANTPPLGIEIKHVDGSFNAHTRNERLAWLKEATPEAETCRILTNARCLSEGVDVPALDAILFLHPRKSQIDVVQSVGRVMRRAEGKKMGYVILPVGVPAGVEPEKALDDNEKYKVVWQILNALRAHDDRLDATINKIDLGVDPGDRIEIVAVTNQMPVRAQPNDTGIDVGSGGGAGGDEPSDQRPLSRPPEGTQLGFQFDEFAKAIMARIVKRCGTRTYWEDWAKDVARIAEVHVTRIRAAVQATGSEERKAFETFLAEIRDDLNDSITEEEGIEMLAQHLITRPVFDALFEGYSFAANNPVSKALQGVLDVLDRQHLEKEAEALNKFYASVRMRAQGIEDATAKQKIVVELYDKFFKAAFPKLTARLGIVYTPVEVVDFIIHSVDEVLQSEFGQTLGSEGVHIIDPFVGTGTFITRLLQSGLIKPEQMAHKYRHEIHANEIVLLAYYIAAINIEAVYHEKMGGDYEPFPGICLTDTFQLYEQDRDLVSDMMAVNSNRRTRQKELDIRVIIGNPPYSAGQNSANDNAANVEYPSLDARIRETYAARTDATNKNALYDSYIRAIRWASDRIGDRGVVGFVTNAGWIDTAVANGLRKCLVEEFSSLHIFHLRGNQRTSGERSRKEGGKIFGQGSRTPVAIAILVKNPASAQQGAIRFHDIGDYLTREQKLAIIARFGGLKGITEKKGWVTLTPDEHGDWLNQRDDSFEAFLPLGDKEGEAPGALFSLFSRGVATARDAWAFNMSRTALTENMRAMIGFYGTELQRFNAAHPGADRKTRGEKVDDFVDADTTKISWNRGLKADLAKDRKFDFEGNCITPSLYRPYTKQWLYYNRNFNDMIYRMPRLFPIGEANAQNLAIMIEGSWRGAGNLTVMVDRVACLLPDGGCQCFPRYLYEVADEPDEDAAQGELLARQSAGQLTRRDAITDEGLRHFTDAYPGEATTKDDVFYYVYGLLHSEEYRERYADNLTKQLPRIPLMKRVEDFRAFVAAGRRLGDLHVNFESVEPFPVTIKEGDLRLANIPDPVAYYRVEKMKFGGKRPNQDKTTVIYNPKITITGIPLEAYDYVVNGKPALEWVMERQCVKTDPASGIVNDANRYAIETVGDPAYPFKLFCRIITVSLETMRIVRGLPGLEIREPEATAQPEPVDALN